MLRDKRFYLRVLVIVLLAGSLFGAAVEKSVHAASVKNPAQQDVGSEPRTDTLSIALKPTKIDTPTRTPKPTRTLAPTRTTVPTLTETPSPTITNTGTLPTPTPRAPHHIVISEFRTTGPFGANDEFIELYNPTGASVNIGNWYISVSSACGTSKSTLVSISYNTILNPGQHYLLAASVSYSSISNADQRFSPGIADTGGLALIAYPDNSMVDEVGMCKDTDYLEGTPLAPLPTVATPAPGTPTPLPETFRSYERKPGYEGTPGRDTSCYDTQNNFKDFKLITPAHPQSYYTPSVMCAGVQYTSPTRTPTITITFTRTPTRVPTAIPAAFVLNEFLPHPQTDWNGDGTTNVGDEYIELINVSPNSLNVKGWKLDMGLNSPNPFTLPDLILQPRQIATFFGSQTGLSLSDGGGTVRLVRSDGRVYDAYTYPVVELPERTWCRLPDGSAVWEFACRPTPGQPNIAVNVLVPGSSSTSGGGTDCPQANIAPQALVLAECGSFGAGITNNQGDEVYWLPSHWKWGVFVE